MQQFVTGRFADWWTHYTYLCEHHKVDPNKGMENNNIKQSFLNTPIEGDSWKEELREIIRQELLLGNVTPSPLAVSTFIKDMHKGSKP